MGPVALVLDKRENVVTRQFRDNFYMLYYRSMSSSDQRFSELYKTNFKSWGHLSLENR